MNVTVKISTLLNSQLKTAAPTEYIFVVGELDGSTEQYVLANVFDLFDQGFVGENFGGTIAQIINNKPIDATDEFHDAVHEHLHGEGEYVDQNAEHSTLYPDHRGAA